MQDRLRQARAAAAARLHGDKAQNKSDRVSHYDGSTQPASNTRKKRVNGVFGCALDPFSDEIPPVLEQCISYLDLSGLEHEGLFRISGNAQQVANLQERFDNGEIIDLEAEVRDPHVVANILKRWFRELPEPLLTFDLYDMFIAAMTIPDIPARIVQLKKVLAALPRGNRVVLMLLMLFLRRVAARSAKNMMGPDNIAIVFAPNLLKYRDQDDIGVTLADTPWANKTLAFFLSHYEDLFVSLESDLLETQGELPAPAAGTAAAAAAALEASFSTTGTPASGVSADDDCSGENAESVEGEASVDSVDPAKAGRPKTRARNMALATMRKGRQAAAASREKGKQAAVASKHKAALARERAMKQYQKRAHCSPNVKRKGVEEEPADLSGDSSADSAALTSTTVPSRTSSTSLDADEILPALPHSAPVSVESTPVTATAPSAAVADTAAKDDVSAAAAAASAPSLLERRVNRPKAQGERRMALRLDGPLQGLSESDEVDARAAEYQARPLPTPVTRSSSATKKDSSASEARPALPPKSVSSASVSRRESNGTVAGSAPVVTRNLPKWPPDS